ncbi:MAG: glycosyltransferase [Caldiserica bacterium]|nr:glycosyltransferase [Caldisericota bacterium]
MIRILYLITDLDIGGAEKNLYYLASHLDRRKFSVRVISLQGEGEIAELLKKEGIYIYPYGAKSKKNFTTFPLHLFKALKEFKPHLMHTFLFHANFTGRIIGRLAGVPCIISSVRVMEKEKRWHIWLERWSKNLIDREICVCRAVKDFRKEEIGIKEDKLAVIYNGLDPEKIKTVIPYPREKLGASEKTFLIGTVSRLEKQKGLPYLFEAIKILSRENPDIILLIVGKGEEERKLKEKVKGMKLENKVIFLGFRRDVLPILASLDLFVLSSLWEGFPNALLEAQALGIPAVATGVGGTGEIIREGESGIIVPPGDSKMLARGISELIKNRSLLRKMGEEARKIGNIFTLERMVREHEKLYQELWQKKLKRKDMVEYSQA